MLPILNSSPLFRNLLPLCQLIWMLFAMYKASAKRISQLLVNIHNARVLTTLDKAPKESFLQAREEGLASPWNGLITGIAELPSLGLLGFASVGFCMFVMLFFLSKNP